MPTFIVDSHALDLARGLLPENVEIAALDLKRDQEQIAYPASGAVTGAIALA